MGKKKTASPPRGAIQDLTGATVVAVAWPPRGFRMTLAGQTAVGLFVGGFRLTFAAVANQLPLRMFLREKRMLRKRVIRPQTSHPIVYTDNQCEAYPLKLPAPLTCLR